MNLILTNLLLLLLDLLGQFGVIIRNHKWGKSEENKFREDQAIEWFSGTFEGFIGFCCLGNGLLLLPWLPPVPM